MHNLHQLKKSTIVVIKGRRRIGKSRLVKEFAEKYRFINITGMPPEAGTSAQDQRDLFVHQLEQSLSIRAPRCYDWIDVFTLLSTHLTKHLTNEPTVILFDEISWMGNHDPTFVPKLKVWWDQDLQHRPNIMLVFCGSVSTWIETNIIKSTAFFGRLSQIIELKPLSIGESSLLLNQVGFKGSAIDKFKILSVLGGVPWYLEQISPLETADHNIHRMCFENHGILTIEFDRIFHDLFQQRGEVYINIMMALKDGMKTLSEIREKIKYSHSGTLSTLMDHLIIAGFVNKFPLWSLKTGKLRKQSLYRISDPYMRFYLHYILPNTDKITKGQIPDMAHLPGYASMMGFQLESLLLQNRKDILVSLGINPIDIVYDNPYLQKASASHKGCQIDYLIQSRTNTLYVCEFKFQNREIKNDIIESMADKIKALSAPTGFGVAPALFHVSGVSEEVDLSGYFYRIIDIGTWLEPQR